jgi:sugar (pentulose or hexulose) kinase
MFPIDPITKSYNTDMLNKFNVLAREAGCPWKLEDILPVPLSAGQDAGTLTVEGAHLLDPSGRLQAGSAENCTLMASPEGDAGTGMAATNSVRQRTGNVSAGTSIFLMAVLEKPLSKMYTAIDMVSTPEGSPTAMVHANTCTSDLDAWVKLFGELLTAGGTTISKPQLYDLVYHKAMEGAVDAGGITELNCFGGEPASGIENGVPLVLRSLDAQFTLPNFARALVYGTFATLAIGMETLDRENVKLVQLFGHGGLFKTEGAAQNLLASALGVPVSVMQSAGEGGPWGAALLAAYRAFCHAGSSGSLSDFLDKEVFTNARAVTAQPDSGCAEGFRKYLERYKKAIQAENAL